MDDKITFRRIVIEEAFRLMALEVVIGLPPIGIAQAMGANQQLIHVVEAISLPVPLVISMIMITVRARSRQEKKQDIKQWRMDKRVWIALGLGTLAAIFLILLYTEKELMNQQQAITMILINLLWIGMGAYLSIRGNLH